MKKADIDAIFATFAEANPHPVTELDAPNPFCLLVAIVLSAQATDVGVNKATKSLFLCADTPQKMLALGEREVPARDLGELVMHELKMMDKVAYIRFASVYRSFSDVDDFHDVIRDL